jgi:hypothetical protein
MSEDYSSWTVDDVVAQLADNDLAEAANLFQDNEISGDMLEYITEDHLKELGIVSVGQRLLVYKFITDTVGMPVSRPPFGAAVSPASPKAAKPHVQFDDLPEPYTPPSAGPAARGSAPPAAPAKRPPPPKPQEEPENIPKYKRDHDKMVETIRAAKKYAAYEKAVQEGRTPAGPAPELAPIDEPEGLIQCPNCGRKFGENAYRHHAGVCERMNAGKRTPARGRR